MASLTDTATVKQTGALTKELFNLSLEGDLTTLIQGAIDDAASWMAVYMGASYNPAGDADAIRVQTKAQAYLALSYLTATLRAQKVYGTHFPYVSEDADSYENLLEQDWEGLARGLLAKWITVEVGAGGAGGTSFAAPAFRVGPGVDPSTADSEDLLIENITDRARGFAKPRFGTIQR